MSLLEMGRCLKLCGLLQRRNEIKKARLQFSAAGLLINFIERR